MPWVAVTQLQETLFLLCFMEMGPSVLKEYNMDCTAWQAWMVSYLYLFLRCEMKLLHASQAFGKGTMLCTFLYSFSFFIVGKYNF